MDGAPKARALAVIVLVSAASIYVLHEASTVVVPTLISLLLAYALEPFVVLMMRLRLSRPSATIITFMLGAILIGSVARAAIREIDAFLSDIPSAIIELRRTISDASASAGGPSAIDRVQTAASEIEQALSTPVAPKPGVQRIEPVKARFDIAAFALNAGVATAVAGGRAVIVVALTFLILCTGGFFKRKAVAFAGADLVRAIDAQIQRYLVVRLLISAIVAAATAIGLWIVGLSHALVWGVVAGALNVIPFIGPGAACALITLAAFLQFKTVGGTVAAGAVATAVAALEGNAITPWLTSRTGEVNIVAVFVSVLFCGWMWDMWGLLLAIPLMVAIKAAADHIEPLQPIGELLGR
jgi:predicted PurR-regulated permease PerM